MKRKRNIDDLGFFNILLIGDNPHAISIADTIHSTFEKGVDMKNNLNFNIVDESFVGNSWFNEFIFELTGLVQYNNIIVSSKFKEWNESSKPPMERIYMKKLLQAMNFVIIDISRPAGNAPVDSFGGGGGYETIFDNDIPQCSFNEDADFLGDTVGWIDRQISKLVPNMATIRLVRSLCGKSIPYLGDVFGCLSGKKYGRIVPTDCMRFDMPILFDEFCHLMKGRDIQEMDDIVVTRTNSALSAFFK